MKRFLTTTALSLLILAAAAPVHAGIGLHAGFMMEPDDFLVGLHWNQSGIAENLSLVPSIDLGFGDATLIGGNLDLHYNFPTNSNLSPYAGAGITFNWVDYDGGSDTGFGGSILGGITLSSSLYFETKLGLGDVPDWKFMIGWHAK